MKIQPASCILKHAIIPIHLIYSGLHDTDVDKSFIGFQHGEEEVVRVRRPLEHEAALIPHINLWIILHGQALYMRNLEENLKHVFVEIWELDK